MSRLPDLVRDSKLETRFHPKYVCHRYLESGFTPQEGAVAREEYWKRVKHIGGGSFGSVWLEKCIKGGRDHDLRAVKDISRSSCWNKKIDYTRELEAMAKFSHPKYVRCFVHSLGWYENADVLSIAMEYFPEGDLHRYLQSSPPLVEVEAQHVVYQIAEGLAFLHENGFAHRDLKPNNILVKSKPPDGFWWVKIGDFGISKRAEDGTAAASTLKGTLAYMSPELHGLVDPSFCFPDDSLAALRAADMWSLGEITYQILTKESAFQNLGKLLAYVHEPEMFPSTALKIQNVTATGISLVRDLMRAEPINRIKVEEVLRHAWTQVCRPIRSKPPSILSLTLSETEDGALALHSYSLPEASGRWSPVSDDFEHLDRSLQDNLTIDPSLSVDDTLPARPAPNSQLSRKVKRRSVEASEVNYDGDDWGEEEEVTFAESPTIDEKRSMKATNFQPDWSAPQRPPKILSQPPPEAEHMPAKKWQTRAGRSSTLQNYRQPPPARDHPFDLNLPHAVEDSHKSDWSVVTRTATLHNAMKPVPSSEHIKASLFPQTTSLMTADADFGADQMSEADRNIVEHKVWAVTPAVPPKAQENNEQGMGEGFTAAAAQKMYAMQHRQSEETATKLNHQTFAAMQSQFAHSDQETPDNHSCISDVARPLQGPDLRDGKRDRFPQWLLEGMQSRLGANADLLVSVRLQFDEDRPQPQAHRYVTPDIRTSLYIAITQVPNKFRELWHNYPQVGCVPINVRSRNFGSLDSWSALRRILLASSSLQSRLKTMSLAKKVLVTLTTQRMTPRTVRAFAEMGLLTEWPHSDTRLLPIRYNETTNSIPHLQSFDNGHDFPLRVRGKPVIACIYKVKIRKCPKLWHEHEGHKYLPSAIEFVICEYLSDGRVKQPSSTYKNLSEVFESSLPYGDKAIVYDLDEEIPTVSSESLYQEWKRNSTSKLIYRPPPFVARTMSKTDPKVETASASLSRMDRFWCKIGGVPLPPGN